MASCSRIRPLGQLLTLMLFSLGYLTATYAEQPISALDTVVVTATKTERTAGTLPQSVTVIDNAQIALEQPANFGDLVEDLPNVDLYGGPRGQAERLVIRGLEDNRILFTLDGARQNFVLGEHKGRFFVDPDLLKRVEIVRGPNSAVWGSGAIGGVVALTSKDASDFLRGDERFGARLKGGYQDVNNQWLLGATVFGLGGEHVDYLLSFTGREADDTEDGEQTIFYTANETHSGLGKVTWVGEQQQLGVSVQLYDETGLIPSNGFDNVSADNPLLDRTTQQHTYTVNYGFAPTRHQRVQATLYRTEIEIEETRVDNGRFDETDFVTTGLDARHSLTLTGHQQQHIVTYGVDIYQDESEARRNGGLRTSFPDGETQVMGGFIQDEWSVLRERLTLIPALRYDRYESESDARVAETLTDNELSMQFGVLFALTDQLTLTANYAEAFRAPNLSELYSSGIHFGANTFVPNPNLKPERAENKEIGLRYQQSDVFTSKDRLQARLAYFRNDVEDFIEQRVNVVPLRVPPFVGGTTTVDNVENAQLEGVEAELAYQHSAFFFNLSYGRTRGEDDDTGIPLGSIAADKWVFTVGREQLAQKLSYGVRFSIVADQDRVPEDVVATDGYHLADVFFSWQPTESLRVNAGIDNLTDKTYRRHLSVLNESGRNFKLSIAYQF